MVAHVNRLNWRTNLSANGIARKLLPVPREGVIRRVNWWSCGSVAESGNILASSMMALVEGPLPEGLLADAIGANSLRDEIGLHVLHQSHGSSSTATNSSASGRPAVPHFLFPGGIWTVEELFVLQITDGGVDNVWSSVGFEDVNIGVKQWQQYRRSSLNTSSAGELIQ